MCDSHGFHGNILQDSKSVSRKWEHSVFPGESTCTIALSLIQRPEPLGWEPAHAAACQSVAPSRCESAVHVFERFFASLSGALDSVALRLWLGALGTLSLGGWAKWLFGKQNQTSPGQSEIPCGRCANLTLGFWTQESGPEAREGSNLFGISPGSRLPLFSLGGVSNVLCWISVRSLLCVDEC